MAVAMLGWLCCCWPPSIYRPMCSPRSCRFADESETSPGILCVMGKEVWRCERVSRRDLIAIAARCHVHCMAFQEAKVSHRGSWEMMSLRGMGKVWHTRRQSKDAPERHFDRFVPHIVCGLMMFSSETYPHLPSLGAELFLRVSSTRLPLLAWSNSS